MFRHGVAMHLTFVGRSIIRSRPFGPDRRLHSTGYRGPTSMPIPSWTSTTTLVTCKNAAPRVPTGGFIFLRSELQPHSWRSGASGQELSACQGSRGNSGPGRLGGLCHDGRTGRERREGGGHGCNRPQRAKCRQAEPVPGLSLPCRDWASHPGSLPWYEHRIPFVGPRHPGNCLVGTAHRLLGSSVGPFLVSFRRCRALGGAASVQPGDCGLATAVLQLLIADEYRSCSVCRTRDDPGNHCGSPCSAVSLVGSCSNRRCRGQRGNGGSNRQVLRRTSGSGPAVAGRSHGNRHHGSLVGCDHLDGVAGPASNAGGLSRTLVAPPRGVPYSRR